MRIRVKASSAASVLHLTSYHGRLANAVRYFSGVDGTNGATIGMAILGGDWAQRRDSFGAAGHAGPGGDAARPW